MDRRSPLLITPVLRHAPAEVRHIAKVPTVWWRHRSIAAGDGYVCHYPKSGSTWLRFLLVALVRPDQELSFRAVDLLIPSVGSGQGMALPSGNQLVSSHHPLGRHVVQGTRIIYLVRDPRHVCASYYAHAIRYGWDQGFKKFFQMFLEGEVDNNGTWGAHVRRAITRRDGSHDVTIVRYEDLLTSHAALSPAASRLGIEPDEPTLDRAFRACSRDRMRDTEHTIAHAPPSEQPFVRRESAPRWAELSHAWMLPQMIDQMGAEMEVLDYVQ